MEAILRSGLKFWRSVAGEDGEVERVLRRYYRTIRSRVRKEYVGENYITFWSGRERRRIGIYLNGSCHLTAFFSCRPAVQKRLDGVCCVFNDGDISNTRSDFLLQTLKRFPEEAISLAVEKLRLRHDYFRPRLFEKTFMAQGPGGLEEFPKTVVAMSIGSDLVRNAYRHRQHGFLVDPGGWWLNQPMDRVLTELSSVTWFREQFVQEGRIRVEDFAENFAEIVKLVKQHTGAHLLVYNVPTVEPGNQTHNYQFVKYSQGRRNREFHLALAELSRKLDFSIVDIDRILKRSGMGSQLDFAHFSPREYQPIAAETFRVMQDLGVF